jgi:hypothetical protein
MTRLGLRNGTRTKHTDASDGRFLHGKSLLRFLRQYRQKLKPIFYYSHLFLSSEFALKFIFFEGARRERLWIVAKSAAITRLCSK